jgi:hypothetical protein
MGPCHIRTQMHTLDALLLHVCIVYTCRFAAIVHCQAHVCTCTYQVALLLDASFQCLTCHVLLLVLLLVLLYRMCHSAAR